MFKKAVHLIPQLNSWVLHALVVLHLCNASYSMMGIRMGCLFADEYVLQERQCGVQTEKESEEIVTLRRLTLRRMLARK